MITILQADKNYKQHPDYRFLKINLEKLKINNNNYYFHIDEEKWISYVDLKIIKLLDVLKKYHDDDIIMYIDALDTYVEANDNEIEEKFLKFNTDVLYSSEKVVWPNPNFAQFFSDNYFLNSGTIIFRNKKYQQILEILIELYNGRLIYNCDQYYHTIFAMIILSEIKIKLDKNNDIFQCLVQEDEENFQLINGFRNQDKLRFKNIKTNTFPCVFHGNGTNGRQVLNKIFNIDMPTISFLGFVEDKLGINFMNTNIQPVKVYAEIKNTFNQVVYSTTLELTPNFSYFIRTGIKDNYIFTIYSMNNEILLQEKNF